MSWRLQFAPAAERELRRLDRSVQRSVAKYLLDVCELSDPASRGHALTGQWAGFHRYRVGQLRLIVRIEHALITVTVIKIGRRDEVY